MTSPIYFFLTHIFIQIQIYKYHNHTQIVNTFILNSLLFKKMVWLNFKIFGLFELIVEDNLQSGNITPLSTIHIIMHSINPPVVLVSCFWNVS